MTGLICVSKKKDWVASHIYTENIVYNHHLFQENLIELDVICILDTKDHPYGLKVWECFLTTCVVSCNNFGHTLLHCKERSKRF